MEMPIAKCKKVRYERLDNAVRDLNLGKEFFTNVSSETLTKIDTPELIKRYFYRLYILK